MILKLLKPLVFTLGVSGIFAAPQAFAQGSEAFADIRNPFRIPPFIQKSKPKVGPLEEFDVAKLQLVAVIAGKGRTRAMVVLPNNKTYYLKLGDKVGTQKGVVRAILPERVLIVEKEKTPLGQMIDVFREITLKGEEALTEEDLKKLLGNI